MLVSTDARLYRYSLRRKQKLFSVEIKHKQDGNQKHTRKTRQLRQMTFFNHISIMFCKRKRIKNNADKKK